MNIMNTINEWFARSRNATEACEDRAITADAYGGIGSHQLWNKLAENKYAEEYGDGYDESAWLSASDAVQEIFFTEVFIKYYDIAKEIWGTCRPGYAPDLWHEMDAEAKILIAGVVYGVMNKFSMTEEKSNLITESSNTGDIRK